MITLLISATLAFSADVAPASVTLPAMLAAQDDVPPWPDNEQPQEDEGFSFWRTNSGHTLIRTAIGTGLAVFFGTLLWAVRAWRYEQLDREYWESVRPEEHSLSRILKRKQGAAVEETTPASQIRAPTQIEWLLGRGLDGLAREITRARVVRKRCDPCRYASSGGPLKCPHAFACGALRHPRASVAYAMLRGLAWFGLALVIMVVICVVMSIIPPSRNSRPMSEAIWFAAPWLLLLAGGACGMVFIWTLWSAMVIRRQVRQTAITADRLGVEFLNFRKLPLETGALAFPLIHPGGVTEVHLAMHGRLNGQPLVVAYYEYEMPERDGPGSDWERKAAVARGAMGKEIHVSWGQLVVMFPEQLVSVPDFQISPLKDIDFHLLRVSRPVTTVFENDRLSMQYCVTSNDPRANGYFGQPLQDFLIANPGWNVQCLRGRLMLWRDKYDVLSAEIAPSKHERLIEDLQRAVRWRDQLQSAAPKSG